MVLLSLRTSQLTSRTLNFFVGIMYYPDFSSSLDLTSSIQKQKLSILTDPMECSILPLSTSRQLEDPFFTPKTHGSTWGSYSTKSSCSTSTLTSIRTKLSLRSNAWSSLGIRCEESTQSKNASYTNAIFYPLRYTGFSYGSITKPLYCTPWKSLEKCRKEPPSGYWELSELRLQTVSKLSLALFPLSSIFKNLQVDLNFALLPFQRITSSEPSWTIPSIRTTSLLPSLLICSLSVRKPSSKDTSSIQIINCLEFSLPLSIQNLTWVLE